MPFSPCMRCFQAFKGNAHNVYLTVYDKEQRIRFRFIVCPECEDALCTEWLTHSLHMDADGDWVTGSPELTLGDLWVGELPRDFDRSGYRDARKSR